MPQRQFYEIAFTSAVKDVQERLGSRAFYEAPDASQGGNAPDVRLTAAEAAFLAARDSFYLATVSETGWPYIQHRGGPPGFVRVLDEQTIGWADFRGNRQYISIGNASADNRVSLFFMDYAGRHRLKLFGRLSIVPADERPELVAAVAEAGYRAKVEHAAVVSVAGFDWNCPQHITPRYSLAELMAASSSGTS